MTVLVTGNAGFIGFHVARRLMARGEAVVGLDNLNDYYDPTLKEERLAVLEAEARERGAAYTFLRADLADRAAVENCFSNHGITSVIHLAAQAGIRHSLENPHAYVQSNLVGFSNVLEACRQAGVAHLTYASTSSVYGANTTMPYSEHHGADHPLQLYAATKRANELMAHSYSHLYALPTTGLRFFTVYGPWGRPDMALFTFTRLMLEKKPLPVFNAGRHTRDFTYIDDIVEGVIRAADRPPQADAQCDAAAADPATSAAPYRIFNIGNGQPVKLLDMIAALEKALGMKAELDLLPAQPGDAADTFADTAELEAHTGYRPRVSMEDGVARFVEWYLAHYHPRAAQGTG